MRVFASVGTHPQQFDRLLKGLDAAAKRNREWKVFAQTGNSAYEPKNFPFKRFLEEAEYGKRIAEADIVISHGGAGTIINSMLQGKRLVVVPRLKRFGEHTNDHQLDLAKALAAEGKSLIVEDMASLEETIRKALSFRPAGGSNKQSLVAEIKRFIDSC